jgi:hypothetical protein
MSSRRLVAAPLLALALVAGGAARVSAQVCECKFPVSNGNGHIAGALGGGLFGGLLAAVLHFKHQHEATLQPRMDPMASDGSMAPLVTAGANGALAAPIADSVPVHGPIPRRGTQLAAAPARAPLLTRDQAQRDGLIPPRTASFLPAFAMIGAGALLIGLFLLRERRGRRRRS